MTRPNVIEFIRTISEAGIQFYETGNLRQKGEPHGSYFKVDPLTPEQLKTLKQFGGWVDVVTMEHSGQQVPALILRSDNTDI